MTYILITAILNGALSIIWTKKEWYNFLFKIMFGVLSIWGFVEYFR